MNRTRTLLAVCAFALPLPAAIAGCGGDDASSEVDPQTVLDETFNNDERVSSGDLSLSVGGSAEGEMGGSFEASLDGPFQGDPEDVNAIPRLDWTGSISGEGAGQSVSFEGALVITEDNAFVEYGGNAYEVGTEAFSQFKQLAESAAAQQTETSEGQSFSELFTQSCQTQLEAQGGDTAACEINFQDWLGDLTNEGEEEIEGAPTVHISGSLDVDTMLQDLIDLGTAVPQAAGTVPSEDEIQQISDAISEASFDLYSGTEDRILRGLDFNLALDPSQIPDAEAAGVESVDANFSLRLSAVNEDQEIEAPSDPQPLEELLSQFGIDPSALGGLGALGGGGLGGLGGVPAPPTGGAGASSAYLDCIAQAQTSEEITACANEL